MKRLVMGAIALAVGGAAPVPAMTVTDETRMVEILSIYRVRFDGAPNEMAQGGMRADRGRELCIGLPLKTVRGEVRGWTGTVEKLSSTGDGYGVLAVRIGDHVTLGTTNNQLSEQISDFKTILSPASAVFKQAVTLAIGTSVVFSGSFFPSKVDCAMETSVSQAGSMQDPEFLFRFTDIHVAQ